MFTIKQKNCDLQNLLQKPRPTRPTQGEVLEPFGLDIFSHVHGFLFCHLFQNENKDSFAFAGNQLSPICQRRLWTESAISLLRFLLPLSCFHSNCSYVSGNL